MTHRVTDQSISDAPRDAPRPATHDKRPVRPAQRPAAVPGRSGVGVSHRNTSGLVIALTIDSADELHHSVRQDRKEYTPWIERPPPDRDLDALVVGAGFGGIYTLYKLRNEQGLDAVAIDKAGGVGGTWYWNKYPGALSDSQSFVYQYSFDRDLYTQNSVDPQVHQGARGPRLPQRRGGPLRPARAHPPRDRHDRSQSGTRPPAPGPSRPTAASPTGPASSSPVWEFCRRPTPLRSTASNTSKAESSTAVPGPRSWT